MEQEPTAGYVCVASTALERSASAAGSSSLRPVLLNVPLAVLAALPLVVLWWVLSRINHGEKAEALRRLREYYQLSPGPEGQLLCSTPPLVEVGVVPAEPGSAGAGAYATQVKLVLRNPEPHPEEGAAHLYRRHAGPVWHEPIDARVMPSLPHETQLGAGLDDEWVLLTEDGQIPALLGERVRREIMNLVGLRRIDFVPSRYRREPPGGTYLLIQLSSDSGELDPTTTFRLLEACDRAFDLKLPPGLVLPAPLLEEYSLVLHCVVGGGIGAVAIALFGLSVPQTTELLATALCDPGDHIEWVHSGDTSNVVCTRDEWRLVAVPILLASWSVVAWSWAALVLVFRALRRVSAAMNAAR